MRTQYLALLGFSPETEKKLKRVVEKSLADDVAWMSATDKNLRGVAVNATFLSSPQVKKYIDRTPAKIVSCHGNSEGEENAKEANVLSLDMLAYTPDELKSWLLGFTEDASFSRELLEKCVVHQSNRSDGSTVKAEKNEEPQYEDFYDDYWLLLENLKKSEQYIYAVSGDAKTWIDIKSNFAYINYDRDEIPKINQLSWKICDTLSYGKTFRRIPLDLWLFESIWSSDIKISTSILPESLAYQLVRWPRPLKPHGRTEALRLAAFAQFSGRTIGELRDKTGYSEDMIRRFIYASLAVKQVSTVEAGTSARTRIRKKPPSKGKSKLGLVSRLRKKLGLN